MENRPEESLRTRASLLGRLKDWQDETSWNEFYQLYRRLIFSVALKAGLSETEAQEVVQETLISVSKNLPGFQYDPAVGSFRSWLVQLTRWRITDQLRKRQRDRQRFQPPSEASTRTGTLERIPDPAGVNLEAVWDAEWARHLMDAALARVKLQVQPRQYQLFDLCVVKQWPVEKIARELHVTAGQVYLAKHRISKLLKEEIKQVETGMDSTPPFATTTTSLSPSEAP
jgi:RNA polymerase sigma factor (sigma-70 family)